MAYAHFSDDFAAAMLAAEKKAKSLGFASLTPQDVLAEAAAMPGAGEAFAKFEVTAGLVMESMAHPVSRNAGRAVGGYAGPGSEFKDLLCMTMNKASSVGAGKAGVEHYLATLADGRPKWFSDAMSMLRVDVDAFLMGPRRAACWHGGGDWPGMVPALAEIGWSANPGVRG